MKQITIGDKFKRQQPPNARFWEFHRGGWVKITLKPDQALRHYFSEPHDEGYSYERVSWTYDAFYSPPGVTRDWTNGGSDCDGPISRSGQDFCPTDELACVPAYVNLAIMDVSKVPANQRPYFERLALAERERNECVTFRNGTPVVHGILRGNWKPVGKVSVYDQYAQQAGY
jgi:hypothetical protein